MIISTVSGSDAPVGGCAGGMISKARNTVRCSASESKTGQPGVLRRRTRTAIRWLLPSIDRIGLSGASRQDAPRFEIDDLIPTAEIADSSGDLGGWYRAPGCPGEATTAVRRTKTHANGHSLWPLALAERRSRSLSGMVMASDRPAHRTQWPCATAIA
jgi:hypothetical protein